MTSNNSTPSTPVGYFDLVRYNANFRNLWIGQIVSLLGDWFNLVASATLIAMITESGLAIGGLFVVRMLAQFLASPIGGVLADKYNRKRLLLLTDIIRAVIVLGFLLVRGPEHVWLLYTLTAIQMALGGIFFPTRNAIIPDVVRQSELGAANALSSATWSTMLALGAALGGIVAGEWGLQPAFVIDSLTFVVSAFFISRVVYQKPEAIQEGAPGRLNIFSQYAEGLLYLKARPDISVLALQKTAQALAITSAFQIIQVALATQIYPIGEGGSTSLGIFYAVVGVGTGLGPILARIFTGDDEKKLRWSILLGYPISSLGLLIMAALVNFPVTLGGTLLRGFGVAMGWVFSTQILLEVVPNRVRGRVFSAEFALLTLAQAFGAGLGGWAYDTLKITSAQLLVIMAALSLLFGLLSLMAGILRLSPRDQNLQPEPISLSGST